MFACLNYIDCAVVLLGAPLLQAAQALGTDTAARVQALAPWLITVQRGRSSEPTLDPMPLLVSVYSRVVINLHD